jgi:multiple sugar transport system permease protein
VSALTPAPRRPWTLRGTAGHLLGLAIAAVFVAPIAWTALTSLKPAAEARLPPLPPWPTTGASLENYAALNSLSGGFLGSAMNSVGVAVATTVLTAVVALLAGYGFSRHRFPFEGLCFVLVLATIMIPFQSIVTPIFLILSTLHLQNSLVGLTLVYVTLQLPFAVFMMRNSFDAVPKEIEEAARMDGANSLQMLILALLPLVWPGLVTVGLFAFLNSWNEFFGALVLLTDQSKYTLPIMVAAVQSGRFGAVNWGAVQAGVTVMMIPCLILFLALQRFYIRGLTAGAVK